MSSALELYDARLSYIQFVDGTLEIHFSYAYIHKTRGGPAGIPATGWSQEAILSLEDPEVAEPLPPLPDSIIDGYLEVAGVRYELIPLPFDRGSFCLLHLELSNGSLFEVSGEHPSIKLIGDKVFLE